MKKLKEIYNKIKKYVIIIGSIILSIIVFILSVMGYKSINKTILSKKEKKLKDKYNDIKKKEQDIKNDIKKIKDDCNDSFDRFNDSPFNKRRNK